MKQVVFIERLEDQSFGIYNENGMCIEPDFATEKEAEDWAIENEYEVY